MLLAHDPSTFKRASRSGIDLQISGHTHGGQIWPFGWVVRLVYPWLAGRYQVGEMTLMVSRGTGTWGPRMRLFHRSDILKLTLMSASSDG